MKNKLWMIFVAAFLVRLISINQSLWLDEATTGRVVQQFNYIEIITKFSPHDFHPPLYYLFMKAWTNVFGYSEMALRMPSVIFSLMTGYIVYKIAKLLNGYIAGVWSASLFLFNPLIVYYSQEARMYMAVTFLLTTALYYLLKSSSIRQAQDKRIKGFKNILLFSIFSSLSFLTFYGSIFLIIPVVLYAIYKKQWNASLMFLLLFTVTVLLLSPLLYQQIINAKKQLSLVPNWNSVLGNANLKNLFLIPIKFSIGRISFYPKWFYWVISLIWTGVVWFFTIRGGLKNKFLFFLIIASLSLGVLFSFFTPLLQYFRFLYLIPLISILIAAGSSETHLKGVRWIVVTGFFVWSLIYILNPNFHREDWKDLAASLPKKTEVYMIISSSDPMKYYRNDLKIADLGNLLIKSNVREIFVVPYTSEIHGIEYRKNLEAHKFKLISGTSYRGIILEKWKKIVKM